MRRLLRVIGVLHSDVASVVAAVALVLTLSLGALKAYRGMALAEALRL